MAHFADWFPTVSTYDSNLGKSLVAPPNNSTYTAEGLNSVTVDAGDYLVLHYGAGQGGSSSGGLVALYFAATTDYSVPQNGSGPNDFGGISFVSLYTGGTALVPDGGSTIFLLGAALTGLAILFRWNKSSLSRDYFIFNPAKGSGRKRRTLVFIVSPHNNG